MSVVGARPQFIKLAPLAPRLNRRFRHLIVHTGQHYDRTMSDIFFKELDIPKADFNLKVGSATHGKMTGLILARLEKLLIKHSPDMILVYGDTNTTLAGALAAAKLTIPVGHIEAGLRSNRMDMPEEINRRLTDQISNLLFCPTSEAMKNLKAEGIKKGIQRSGDLMYELLYRSRTKIERNKGLLKKYSLLPHEYLLLTVHRACNVDNRDNLVRLAETIMQIKQPIIFPVHPHTMKNLRRFHLLGKLNKLPYLKIVEPVSYLDNLTLINFARAVLTDSGGVQKETIFLKTPCLTLRDETEWVETLNWGNYLVGLSVRKMKARLSQIRPLRKDITFKIKNKYPSEIITGSIADFFKG